jgi:nucleotide-binding universal stress UspA family protein
MLNILVPTDFSPLSKVAVQYAIKIASKLKCDITLLHVITLNKPTRVTTQEKIKALEEELLQSADRDLLKFIKNVWKDNKSTITIHRSVVRSSDFPEAVKKEAKRLKTGLLIMGTKGASGLKKAMVGSNTTAVIETINIPVLVVPEKAKFSGFKDLVYASDLKNLEKELKIMVMYSRNFGSTIHVVHVTQKGKDVDSIEQKIDKAVSKMGYDNIVSLVLVDPFIEGAIDQYLNVSKAAGLAMFTHDLSFYEKLLDKSVTRKMAFHSTVPLLAFKKKATVPALAKSTGSR